MTAPALPGGAELPAPDGRDGEPAAARTDAPATVRRRFRLGRPPVRRLLRLPRSKRGILALLLVLGGFGGVAAFGGVTLLHWTETADFCGRCHAMEPELAAYEAGPHRDVACAECHVEPGIAGWVKAKVNGTRQLVEMALGTFPTPIPPPDHAELPSAADTCMRCHSVEGLELAELKTRSQFTADEANTRQFVGLLIRPGGGDLFDADRSVHWHVLRDVVYRTADEDSASIDYVAARAPDGSVREFISQRVIEVADDVRPEIARLKRDEIEREMTCYDCHNRVGHPIPNPRRGIDRALATGEIDTRLPYIKREAMRILWGEYADVAAADREAEALRDFYRLEYPAVYRERMLDVNRAIAQVKLLYRLTATPEMKVTARTYPDNLGHTDFAGCFRCHDGGHYLVEAGAVTREVIPASCDACHTFPQLGSAIAGLPLGIPPESHDDTLFVFNHRTEVDRVDPGGASCGECHARDYCVNCHQTGAVDVDHDEMLVNHAEITRQAGNEACAYCHQPVYCARCHAEPVLPGGQPLQQGEGTSRIEAPAPPGIRWPLRPPA